jgi:hypothetical protein
VWKLQEETEIFLYMKDKELMFPQLEDENWRTDLDFLVDVLEPKQFKYVCSDKIPPFTLVIYKGPWLQNKTSSVLKKVKENKLTYYSTLRRINVISSSANKYSKSLAKY